MPAQRRSAGILAWILERYPLRYRQRFAVDLLDLFEWEADRIEGSRGRRARRWFELRTTLAAVWGLGLEWVAEVRIRLRRGSRVRGDDTGRGGGVMETFDTIWTELRWALRGLRRSPGFTATVIVTLGLGVGANTAMFEVVDQVMLRPPPFLRTDQPVQTLYYYRTSGGDRRIGGSFSYPAVRDLQEAPHGLEQVFASAWRDQIARFGDRRGKVLTLAMSGTGWSLFDLAPVQGRFFGPDDDRLPSGSSVAVISQGLWEREFGGDPEAVGRTLEVAERRYEIIGVAPRGFRAMELREPDVFLPLTTGSVSFIGDTFAERYGTTYLTVRVKPSGAGLESSRGAVEQSLVSHFTAHYGEDRARDWDLEASFQPLHTDRGPYPRSEARFTLWLLGMAAVVFLTACANVATLMTGRTLERRQILAVRSALGIGAGRLMLGPLVESLLLAALGVVVAGVVANTAVGVVTATLLPDAAPVVTGLTPRSILFGVLLTTLASVLVSLLPVWRAHRSDLGDALRSGSRGGRSRSLAQSLLPATQAALCALLLVGAGLFVRSVRHASTVELGFAPESLALVDVETSGAFDSFKSAAELGFSMDELVEAARAVPGVRGVALATSTPFLNTSVVNLIREDGTHAPGSGELGGTSTGTSTGEGVQYLETSVTPEYFAVMGTPILEGRGIEAGDTEGTEPVVVVSEAVARAVWPAPDGVGHRALGQCVHVRADTVPCHRVVGIAGDIRRGDLRSDDIRIVYRSWAQGDHPFRGVILVRAEGPGGALAQTLREGLDPWVPQSAMVNVIPVVGQVEERLRSWTVGARIFTAFGVLALIMAGVGLFSVVAWEVSQRTREFGVRMAFGAGTDDLIRLVLNKGLWLTAGGVFLGLLAAAVLSTRLESLLFGVGTHDPITFATVAVVLLSVSAAACVLPALRAARVDPQVVLREE